MAIAAPDENQGKQQPDHRGLPDFEAGIPCRHEPPMI
jgi:hypothetical protein